MNSKLSKIYYSPRGYWKGLAAVKKLAAAAKASEEVTKKWLAQTSPVANIPPRPPLHPAAQV